jgi:coenzyme PQQ synthesis protein D (PqqD)
MKRSNGYFLPKARKNDLVTRQIPGELLVYDLKRHKAFCLNDTAASVWKNCNGKRTVKDLALALEKDQQTPVDDKVIWLALDQLEKSNLLQANVIEAAGFPSVSRRSLLRAGIVTAVALPIVTMIAAPTAQAAGTPVASSTCQGRHPSDPGGCGGNPCSDATGSCLQQGVSNACKCL